MSKANPNKTILITGSTDGIGLETAKDLVKKGHRVLIHGRNAIKLENVRKALSSLGTVETYQADLSSFDEVKALAVAIQDKHPQLDILINNAGLFKLSDPSTAYGLDARFVVNTLAPYLLTQLLLPLIPSTGRVVNLSSAAQASVDPKAMAGEVQISDMPAYAQSKLALTMWSQSLGQKLKEKDLVVVSVNPGSLLATKMVKEAFGTEGNSITQGSDILVKAALSEDFAKAYGYYFDNDNGRFSAPHSDASQPQKVADVVQQIEALLKKHNQNNA